MAALHKTAAIANNTVAASTHKHNSSHKQATATNRPPAAQVHNLQHNSAADADEAADAHNPAGKSANRASVPVAGKGHNSKHKSAAPKVASHSVTARIPKCLVGQSVRCPDSEVRCANSGCCPDGSLCPSSVPLITGSQLGASCPKPKAFDCTGIKAHDRHQAAHSHRPQGVPPCLVGANVQCPRSGVNCSAGCCPDGSLCPSAPLGVTCPKPKAYDCTGQVQLSDSRWPAMLLPGGRASASQNLLLASAGFIVAAALALALFAWQAGRRRRSRLVPDYLHLGSALQLHTRALALPG